MSNVEEEKQELIAISFVGPGGETKPNGCSKPLQQDPDNKPVDKIKTLTIAQEVLMKHFVNIREILTCSNATAFRTYGRNGFECAFCDKEYANPADLKTHSLKSNEGIEGAFFEKEKDLSGFTPKLDITDLQCNICKSDIDNLEPLVNHLINDHGKKLYTDFKSQIIPFKFHGEDLTCFICSNKFNRFKVLLEHMPMHLRNYVCETCNSAFITYRRLTIHARIHDIGEFKCKLCEKLFETNVKRRYHMRSIHSNKKVRHICGTCGQIFDSYRAKESHHFQEHGFSIFKCETCNKKFKHQKEYQVHLKRDHLMERNFECDLCDKKFVSARTLKAHTLTHTGVKNYQCDICSKSYGLKATLREHLRSHADDRRYKCDYCPQAFVQKCSWKSHLRSMHGETDL